MVIRVAYLAVQNHALALQLSHKFRRRNELPRIHLVTAAIRKDAAAIASVITHKFLDSLLHNLWPRSHILQIKEDFIGPLSNIEERFPDS